MCAFAGVGTDGDTLACSNPGLGHTSSRSHRPLTDRLAKALSSLGAWACIPGVHPGQLVNSEMGNWRGAQP